MKKVYVASGISDIARKHYQKQVAKKIREKGYKVYAAAENNSINDKTNDPTPLDIYNADVGAILSSDIFVQVISGGNEDGTNYESGIVAGINEERARFDILLQRIKLLMRDVQYNKVYNPERILDDIISMLEEYQRDMIEIIAYSINERMLVPQFFENIPSAGYNHLILGGIDKWGKFSGLEDNMLSELEER